MKIVIAGGTGFLGGPLAWRLAGEGESVVVLTRNPGASRRAGLPGIALERWDGGTPGPWEEQIDGADAVINLAGESIAGGRWSVERKRRLRESRLSATRALVRAIGKAGRRPGVLVSASAVGYYGHVPEGDVTESTPPAKDFLGELSREWESEALAARDPRTRVALIRIGIVLGRDGGALGRMLLPFRLFVGGPLGSGKQYFPWVHRDDVIGAVVHLLKTPGLAGPFNIAAPDPVRMSEFCRELGRTLRRPSWAAVPAFALRLLLGEMSAVVLAGQRVIPARLLESGYRFAHPTLRGALDNILA